MNRGLKCAAEGSAMYAALFVSIAFPLVFGAGQEIFAIAGLHDDYNFVLRADAWNLKGHYLAPIKEVLYPLYIRLSWLFGLSLRDFEVVCYGLALYSLWAELAALARSKIVGLCAVIPLTLFCYQHAVFNRATYDALQLILIPLTFSSAIRIYRESASWPALLWAGSVVGGHVLTRPEGFLFALPPLASLLLLWLQSPRSRGYLSDLKPYLLKGIVIVLSGVLGQQIASAVNWRYFGFWAPTIIQSGEFQHALGALMALRPVEGQSRTYTPFPKSSMEEAFEVSPEFRKAKSYFEKNLDGLGWSGAAIPNYRAIDGSISGGHFQWALLDASAFVAGGDPKAILAYLNAVSRELEAAYQRGQVQRRPLLSAVFGPAFTVAAHQFWVSAWRIGVHLVSLGEPILPAYGGVLSSPRVEADFDRLALRKTALLAARNWQLSGWVVDPRLGAPTSIVLDAQALRSGSKLDLIDRPDVAKALSDADPVSGQAFRCGFELTSPDGSPGNLVVEFAGSAAKLPLDKLKSVKSGQGWESEGVYVHLDHVAGPTMAFKHTHLALLSRISAAVHKLMGGATLVTLIFLLSVMIFRERVIASDKARSDLLLIGLITLSLAIPRWVLLSAIDSAMYPGDEPRYIAVAVFSVWVLAAFSSTYLIYSTSQIMWRKLQLKWKS